MQVQDLEKLDASEPFAIGKVEVGDRPYFVVDNWHWLVGVGTKLDGLYEARQKKDSNFIYQGIWQDEQGVVSPWCLNAMTGRIERCKIVRRCRRFVMVTIYGEDVALVVKYVDIDEVEALHQLRNAAEAV